MNVHQMAIPCQSTIQWYSIFPSSRPPSSPTPAAANGQAACRRRDSGQQRPSLLPSRSAPPNNIFLAPSSPTQIRPTPITSVHHRLQQLLHRSVFPSGQQPSPNPLICLHPARRPITPAPSFHAPPDRRSARPAATHNAHSNTARHIDGHDSSIHQIQIWQTIFQLPPTHHAHDPTTMATAPNRIRGAWTAIPARANATAATHAHHVGQPRSSHPIQRPQP
ncbi:hypothetical protein ACLOJK_034740 [Asimina triloba]